jgi:serine/threonine-protein kinase
MSENDLKLHEQIARVAVTRGEVTWGEACALLLEVGQLSERFGHSPRASLWVDRGLLSAKALSRLVGELRPDTDEYRSLSISGAFDSLLALDSVELDSIELADDAPTHSEPLRVVQAADVIPDTVPLPALAERSAATQTLMKLPERVMARRREQLDGFERMKTVARDVTPLDKPVLEETSSPAVVSLRAPARMLAAAGVDTSSLGDGASPRRATTRITDPFQERYELGKVLGQGGGGRVVRAYDSVLGRCVAMKILPTDSVEHARLLTRFIAEAQTTGQLEHPNIMPIYDFGTLPTGEVFYTMQELRKNSLREVIEALAADDPEAATEFPLTRLINILKQVCLAVRYAHARGVVHRDLKPDNIMLGDYGEVLVMDWGLARVLGDVSTSAPDEVVEKGQTMGTPAYMPPEQARGELEQVDELSDVYALGAILYEILTLTPPYDGDSPIDVMWDVVEGPPPTPRKRAPRREIPEMLERICLRAMSRERVGRYMDARALHDDLTAWVEGYTPDLARRLANEAYVWASGYTSQSEELELLDARIRELAEQFEGWEAVSRKRALWALEDERDACALQAAHAFGQAVSSYTQSLALLPGYADARCGLAALFAERFEQAERQGDTANSIYFRALVAQHDEENRFAHILREEASLTVALAPGTHASLQSYIERDRVLCLDEPVSILDGDALNLTPGRYLITARDGDRVARIPVALERGASRRVDVTLPPEPPRDGFVWIPGGPFPRGGDPEAIDPQPRTIAHVDGFYCAVLPVTFGEYLEWINALQRVDPGAARARAPQLRSGDGLLVKLDPDTGLWSPDEILIEGSARARYPIGQGYELDIPVVGIDAHTAAEYVEWRAARDHVAYRLPTSAEMEKAGRGTDGRFFPWGDRFDPTFCKMRFSRPELPQLEPVGAFPIDVSPYGVRDLAGSAHAWCAHEGDPDSSPISGGSWNRDARSSRLANSLSLLSVARTSSVGIRLVYS